MGRDAARNAMIDFSKRHVDLKSGKACLIARLAQRTTDDACDDGVIRVVDDGRQRVERISMNRGCAK